MNTFLNARFTKLSVASCLALAVAACGSDDDDTPPSVTFSSAMSSSSAAMSSSTASMSSSSQVNSSSEGASSSVVASSSSSVAAVPVAAFSWDFEGVSPGVPTVPGWSYTGDTAGGTSLAFVESAGLGYSGDTALQVTTVDQEGSFLTINDFSGSHWGRVYYKATDVPDPVPTWSHTTLVAAYDSQTQTHYRLVDMVAAPSDHDDFGGYYQHLYNIDNPAAIDLSLEGGYTNTYDGEWVCLEWQVDAVNQEYHVFFNENEIALNNKGNPSNATDLEDADNWKDDEVTHDFIPVPASFDQLKIGIQNYQGHGFTFLIDDVAISDARVGCDVAGVGSSSSALSSSSVMASTSAMSSSSDASSSLMMSSSSEASSSSGMSSSSVMSSSSAVSSSSTMSSSSEMASSSAPSGPTQAEIDARVAAGLALYEQGNAAGNICSTCHGADGTGGASIAITNSTRTYDELVTLIGNGGDGMPACAPMGDCAEQLTDYVWVEFLGGTLTNDGGTR